MTWKFAGNDRGNPPGKLADAELWFEAGDGPLAGLKLIGFGIWERRGSGGVLHVTRPARQYSVNGERRAFALLRDTTNPSEGRSAMDRDCLAAFEAWQLAQTEALS